MTYQVVDELPEQLATKRRGGPMKWHHLRDVVTSTAVGRWVICPIPEGANSAMFRRNIYASFYQIKGGTKVETRVDNMNRVLYLRRKA